MWVVKDKVIVLINFFFPMCALWLGCLICLACSSIRFLNLGLVCSLRSNCTYLTSHYRYCLFAFSLRKVYISNDFVIYIVVDSCAPMRTLHWLHELLPCAQHFRIWAAQYRIGELFKQKLKVSFFCVVCPIRDIWLMRYATMSSNVR